MIFSNALLVLPDEVLNGSVVVSDGKIIEIQPGRSTAPGAIELDGDYLMPGVVDVHTDNLERQVQPRLNARWPSRSAMLAHDAQCAAAGVTTVLDALCLGELGFDKDPAARPSLRRGTTRMLSVAPGSGRATTICICAARCRR